MPFPHRRTASATNGQPDRSPDTIVPEKLLAYDADGQAGKYASDPAERTVMKDAAAKYRDDFQLPRIARNRIRDRTGQYAIRTRYGDILPDKTANSGFTNRITER